MNQLKQHPNTSVHAAPRIRLFTLKQILLALTVPASSESNAFCFVIFVKEWLLQTYCRAN
jgi:hypothetical protein